MAISFNKESVFNLKPIDVSEVRNDVTGLLIDGEEIIAAFKTIRDQLVFTNKRIISVDVQGLTGKRKSFTTMPYSKVQFFTSMSIVPPIVVIKSPYHITTVEKRKVLLSAHKKNPHRRVPDDGVKIRFPIIRLPQF